MEKSILFSKTMRNIKYVMFVQGAITIITTLLNILLARFVAKKTYGFVNINATLVVSFTNNLLKGGFRMAFQKSEFSPKKSDNQKNTSQSIINSVFF